MVKKSFRRRPESNVVVVVNVVAAAGSHDTGNRALDDKFACSNANSNVLGGPLNNYRGEMRSAQ